MQGAYNGTLILETVSGRLDLIGGRASITCGVTGNATASMNIAAGSSSITLNCPTMAVEGLASNAYGQVSFPPASSVTENVTFTASLPSASDTITLVGYSLQGMIASSGPTIIADGTGVRNAGTLEPSNIVSGSWVAIRGSGFVDPGVSMDWSNSDFSQGLPTSLDNLQVLFDGRAGAMLYVGDMPAVGAASQQINVQAPANHSGPVSVQVIRNNIASNVVTTNAVTAAPGLFAYTLDGGRSYYPAALLANYPTLIYLGDPSIFPGSQKAKTGDLVSLYANSLAVSPAGIVQVSGSTDPVTVTIGGTTIAASFAGLIAPANIRSISRSRILAPLERIRSPFRSMVCRRKGASSSRTRTEASSRADVVAFRLLPRSAWLAEFAPAPLPASVPPRPRPCAWPQSEYAHTARASAATRARQFP